MRVKSLTMGMTMAIAIALALALVTELPAVSALSQDNTNQSNANSSRRRRGRRPPPPPPAAETTPPEATPAATETPAAPRQARRRGRRGGARAMRGVPSGVQNCIDHLIQMASADPLIPYEGHPSEIINNGLMWNDPKSKCSVGADSSLRLKISNLITAWNQKEAEKVRSLLQEIKTAAPQ